MENKIDPKFKMIKFLAEFKTLCEKKERFSAGELCNIHNIGRSIPTVMQNIKLITNNRYGLWSWDYTGGINIDLVLKITDAVRLYQLDCKNRRKEIQSSIPFNESQTLERIEIKIDKILKALAII